MGKAEEIKKYIEEILPKSEGDYTCYVGKEIWYYAKEDDKLVFSFLYEKYVGGIIPVNIGRLISNIFEKKAGVVISSKQINRFQDGKSLLVNIFSKYTKDDELDKKVTSKGFRTLLGLDK